MITHVHIKNYRSLENVSVDLGRLTVLVGRNGAGKSNFVDALQFVQDALLFGMDMAIPNRGGLSALRRWTARGRPGEVEIEISIKRGTLSGTYSFVLAGGPGVEFKIKRESCRAQRGSQEPEEYEIRDGVWVTRPERFSEDARQVIRSSSSSERLIKKINSQVLFLPSSRVWVGSALQDMYRFLTGNNFFAIYPNTINGLQKFSTETRMGDHGENFASALRYMKQRWETQQTGPFLDLLAALKRVVDDISDVRVNPVGSYLVTELKHIFRVSRKLTDPNETSPWFELSQESDGTLRALGLLIGLYQNAPRNGLMAIEEPEMNIHPGALAVLADVLREAADRRQVLLTTHSPDLISEFSANELRIVERTSGSTRIGQIAEAQRKVIKQQLFTAGDLLRIEGLQSSVEEIEAIHA